VPLIETDCQRFVVDKTQSLLHISQALKTTDLSQLKKIHGGNTFRIDEVVFLSFEEDQIFP
jgi:hypothetical protein